jgi:hypothetical protein
LRQLRGRQLGGRGLGAETQRTVSYSCGSSGAPAGRPEVSRETQQTVSSLGQLRGRTLLQPRPNPILLGAQARRNPIFGPPALYPGIRSATYWVTIGPIVNEDCFSGCWGAGPGGRPQKTPPGRIPGYTIGHMFGYYRAYSERRLFFRLPGRARRAGPPFLHPSPQ